MRSPWSLRKRLVLGIVALLAMASIVVGAVSVLALNRFLVGRLDSQLIAATSRSQDQLGDGGDSRPDTNDRPGAIPIPGLGNAGTVAVLIAGGVVVDSQAVGEYGDNAALTSAQEAEILATVVGRDPVDVHLDGELGEYRMIASDVGNGTILVIGLPLSDVRGTILQLVGIIVLVTAIALIVSAIVGTAIVRLALRPLERVVSTATRVSELTLDKGDVALAERVPEADTDSRTEVGQVGAALNRLLGHVSAALTARQASENKVRQFVADASHELRTPLASIRGYSELTRRGGHALPDDVVHSLGRIESESIRMTSLVEELLLLARLDDGGEIRSETVELSRVLADAVSDAHAAGPDHEWNLELPDEPVELTGDSARLHQVVVNLLSNARTHTPAGTTVTVTLSREADEAVITVEDDGPGIAPALQPTLFERFVRGDTSRSRAAGSTGLGLAIVHAVVEAHGGAVGVESRPGRTVFSIRLPIR